MPRPKGPGTESCADLFYLWAIAGKFVISGLAALYITLTPAVQAETVNRAAKVSVGCTTIDNLAEDIVSKFPDQESVRLENNAAASFMSAWNKLPPVSNVAATQLLVLFHERAGIAKVAFFKNGCVFTVYAVPVQVVRALLRKARGAAI